MTLRTVVEITPQLEAVTPDTFIYRGPQWHTRARTRRASGVSPPIASALRHPHQQQRVPRLADERRPNGATASSAALFAARSFAWEGS
jgi:hypothetical protein